MPALLFTLSTFKREREILFCLIVPSSVENKTEKSFVVNDGKSHSDVDLVIGNRNPNVSVVVVDVDVSYNVKQLFGIYVGWRGLQWLVKSKAGFN